MIRSCLSAVSVGPRFQLAGEPARRHWASSAGVAGRAPSVREPNHAVPPFAPVQVSLILCSSSVYADLPRPTSYSRRDTVRTRKYLPVVASACSCATAATSRTWLAESVVLGEIAAGRDDVVVPGGVAAPGPDSGESSRGTARAATATTAVPAVSPIPNRVGVRPTGSRLRGVAAASRVSVWSWARACRVTCRLGPGCSG